MKPAPALLEYLEKRLGKSVGSGGQRRFHCPKCIDRVGSESTHPNFGFDLHNRVGHCFRCDYGTGLEGLFKDLNNGKLLFVERQLLARDTAELPEGDLRSAIIERLRKAAPQTKQYLVPIKMPKEAVPLWKDVSYSAMTGIKYLAKRGIPDSQIEEFQIHYASTGTYQNRLIFPITTHGKHVYFTTRYCGDHYAKALNPPNMEQCFHKTDVLMNFDRCVGAPLVAVTEGAFSCMAFPHAVALLGKTIGDKQLALLDELVKAGTEELVIALDPDAQEYAEALYDALVGRAPTVSILYLDYGDPHDRRAEITTLLEGRCGPSPSSRLRAKIRARRSKYAVA